MPSAGAVWAPLQYAVAATLTWPEAVVSHRTAATLHEFPVAERAGADVIVRSRYRARRCLRPHGLHLSAKDVTTGAAGIWMTVPQRTAFDCLAEFDLDEAIDLWAWLTTRQVVLHPELVAEVERRKGWHGTPQLARLARLTKNGAVSWAEITLHELLQANGIRGWQAGVRIGDAEGVIGVADVCFPAQRVILEVDGYRAHTSQSAVAFARGLRRQTRLNLAGYLVIHLSWDELVNHPDRAIATIRAALSGRP